ILTHSSPEVRSVRHIVSFAHPLEENPEVKIPVLTGKVQSKPEPRGAVANDGPVSRVSQGIAAAVDGSVPIEVCVHDVSCFPVAAYLVLSHSFQVSIYFSLGLDNAYGSITPYFVVFPPTIPL